MKKNTVLTSIIAAFSIAALALTGCSSSTADTASDTTADTSAADNAAADTEAADANAETEAETEAADTTDGGNNAADGDNVIKIGATSTPHGEILEFVKDKLAEQGYDLQITIYDDYVLPDKAVADGELDRKSVV